MRRLLLLSAPLAPLKFLPVRACSSNQPPNLKDLAGQVQKITSQIELLEESKAANALVALYASRKMKDLDVKRILNIFANNSFHSPIYCHKNLPMVLAHFITGLDNLPSGLNAMPSIAKVRGLLLSSFQKITGCPIPAKEEDIQRFRAVLEDIDETHAEGEILQTMAIGILELKEHISAHRQALLELKRTSQQWKDIDITEDDVLSYEDLEDIQTPMDFCNECMVMYNFISRMFLNIDTSGMSSEAAQKERVGMVDLEVNLENVVRNAIDQARQICNDHYGDCPDVQVKLSMDSKPFRFPYMTTTVRYIVLELMKNAFRATVEAHMKKNEIGIVTCDDMPPVRVLINLKEGTQHACICVSDEGRGMTLEALEMAMAYSYTSVGKNSEGSDGKSSKATVSGSPLAGYGYGLPMSRVYARSLGGDLLLQTMEGFGTRAYYFIKL